MDAAWAPDPFRRGSSAAAATSVVHPYQATIPGLTVLTNITTQELLDEDPELVADFAAAMAEALDWAAANEDAVRAAIATNLEIPEEAAAGITLPDLHVRHRRRTSRTSPPSPSSSAYLDAEPDFDRLIQQQ